MPSVNALARAIPAFLARISLDSWRDEARCLDSPELFFPDNDTGPAAQQAKAICKVCPVRVQCLELALTNDERAGIWGGFTTTERGKMPRTKQRKQTYGRIAA